MSQVSKKYIKQEKLNKIFSLFFDLVTSVKNKNEADITISELLTPTEKVMLAKRITCFYLILKDIPNREIADLLKLSTSTVCYLKHTLNNLILLKKFLSKRLFSEKIQNIFIDILTDIFYGMPRKGANWGVQKQTYDKLKKSLREPL